MASMLQKWFKFKIGKDRPKAPDYAECKRILLKEDSKKKTKLANSQGVPPEILYYLSTDKDHNVRCAVARNPETPIQADVILSKDKEVQVRLALSEKLAELLPDLNPEQNEKVTEMAYEILETLAVDQDKQVRIALANSVKSLGTVPKSIAMTLAEDPDDAVALPILEFSSLLDDHDLMGLIVGGLRHARLGALACRAELSASVANAVVETGDKVAIPHLIKNETAEISDEAFDKLIKEASNSPKWLDILAVREEIPDSTLLKIARMASGSLLKKLKARSGLDLSVAQEIDKAIDEESTSNPDHQVEEKKEETLEDRIEKMHSGGKLTEKVVMKAVSDRDLEFVSLAMAKIAGVPAPEVRKVFSMASAKSILALAWRCDFNIKNAVTLQKDLAQIPNSKLLVATNEGGYPLSEDELLWQSDLIFST
jgi:uncharacterized protein (DUF2336 family)